MPLVRLADSLDVLRNLGVRPTVHFAVQRLRNRFRPPELLTVRSKYARHPLQCRRGSSDLEVFGQIFSHREYRSLSIARSS